MNEVGSLCLKDKSPGACLGRMREYPQMSLYHMATPQWQEEDWALPRGARGSRGIPGEWSQELLTQEPGRSHTHTHTHTQRVCTGMDTHVRIYTQTCEHPTHLAPTHHQHARPSHTPTTPTPSNPLAPCNTDTSVQHPQRSGDILMDHRFTEHPQ